MNVINQDAGVVFPRYKGPVTREGYEANPFAGMSEKEAAARLLKLQQEKEEAIAEAVSSRPKAALKKKSTTETATEA